MAHLRQRGRCGAHIGHQRAGCAGRTLAGLARERLQPPVQQQHQRGRILRGADAAARPDSHALRIRPAMVRRVKVGSQVRKQPTHRLQ